jgi:hypothetical protein
MDNRQKVVWLQHREEMFLLNAHTGYGDKLASYSVGNGDPFFGGKAAGE